MQNQKYRKILSNISGISIPFLSRIDQSLSNTDDKLIEMPLICIVGPPRVGSTILYQTVVNSIDVDYFTNIEYLFYRYPNISFYLNSMFSNLCSSNSSGSSTIGFESGLFSPSEFSRFWEDFFYYSLNDSRRSENLLPVSHAISALNKRWIKIQKPLITSWNPHVFYYKDIIRKFKYVLFVVMIREPIEIARSIYHSRVYSKNKLDEWWSYIPHHCIKCKSSYQQIACQTACFLKQSSDLIDDDVASLVISYNEFCNEPLKTISKIVARFHSETNIEIPNKIDAISLNIKRSAGMAINNEDKMKECLSEQLSKMGVSYNSILHK
jgi:hypothetical protein